VSDWTQAGVHPVAPGVHRIPLPLPNDGLRAVNVYAITDGDSLALVDPGWALDVALEQLRSGLAELGAEFADVDRILVTHAHRDHYTQAVHLRRLVGTHISLGAGEKPTIDAILAGAEGGGAQGRLAHLTRWGAEELLPLLPLPDAPPGTWEEPDCWLTDRIVVQAGGRGLEAVATPGHTRGHMVFVDDQHDLLFAGDHVLPSITPSIAVEPAPERLALRDYMDSLRLVRAMPDRMLLPAHGDVTPSAHARIDQLLEHHDVRLQQSLLAVSQGCTAADVARVLRWTRRERKFADLGPGDQMLATSETAAHLDLLVHQGRLCSAIHDGVVRYGS